MIKEILHENLKNSEITKLSIFDFDGTICDSGTEESIRRVWKEKTGTDWRHKGFWGQADSLNDEVFDFQPIVPTVEAFKKEVADPKTFVVISTGRLEKLRSLVQNLLNKFDLTPDELYLNPGGINTITYKLRLFSSLVARFPNLKSVEIWEDRDPHIEEFKKWGERKGLNVIVNQVVA